MYTNKVNFKQITLHDWRQFKQVEIDFHDRLTVIVGPNGSGKTTILNILAGCFGWELPHVSTPRMVQGGSPITWLSDSHSAKDASDSKQVVGQVEFNHDVRTQLKIPEADRQYKMSAEVHGLAGIHIPSHRPPLAIDKLEQIRIEPIGPAEMLKAYQKKYKGYLSGGWSEESYENRFWKGSPTKGYLSTMIKEWLVHLVVTGSNIERDFEGVKQQYVTGSPLNLDLVDAFAKRLSQLLPKELGFTGFGVRGPDVVLRTTTGEFNFDSLSGGLLTLVDICFQLFLMSEQSKTEFVVTFDEPENHLHPSMQSVILPKLLNAFPEAQFIVATHSPVVVNSVQDSSIYVLGRGDGNLFSSHLLSELEMSGTANDMLREALGVESPMPVWAANKLDELIGKYSAQSLTRETAEKLDAELREAGLSKYSPIAAARSFRNKTKE